MTNKADKKLRNELQKLFKDYAVGVSAGMSATVARTVDDANKHLEAVVTLAEALINSQREQVLDSIGKPKFSDFDLPAPPEYERMVSVINWYADRIKQLKEEK